MSGVIVRGVIFLAYSKDHVPRHVHGFIGGKPQGKGTGEVIVDLREDGTVALADHKVLKAAALAFDRLVAAWEEMHVE